MRILVLHFVLCFILFADFYSDKALRNKTFYKVQKKESWVKNAKKRLKPHIDHPEHLEFLISITTGDKRRFKKLPLYESFKNAHLLHLLTPSGLHLSALLAPFFYFMKRPWQIFMILSLVGSLLFSQSGFLAAKRVFILKSLLKCQIPIKVAFIITFMLALIFHSGLSFLMSYLFLGILVFNPHKEFLPTLYLFMIAELMICYFFKNSFYPLSLIINPLVTSITVGLFPLLVLSFMIPPIYFVIKPLVGLVFQLVNLTNSIAPVFPTSLLSIILLGSVAMIAKHKKKRLLKLTLCFALFIFQPIAVI